MLIIFAGGWKGGYKERIDPNRLQNNNLLNLNHIFSFFFGSFYGHEGIRKRLGKNFKLYDVFKGKKKYHTFLTAIQLQVKNLTACRVLIRAHYNLIDLHWQSYSSCPYKMEILLLCRVLIQ